MFSILALVALCAAASTALAGTASVSGGLFTYTAEPGEVNAVSYTYDGMAFTVTDTAAPITAAGGCSSLGSDTAICAAAGVSEVEVSLLDGDDSVTADPGDHVAIASIVLSGGSGADILVGGDDADTLLGGGGSDEISGQEGNDALVGGSGADQISGAGGYDIASYDDTSREAGVTVSLDDQANDGGTGEGDNVDGQIDEVVGTEWADQLAGGWNDAVLRGGDGADQLSGGDTRTWLVGGAGLDTYIPGGGLDLADYSDHSQSVAVTIGAGADDGSAGEGENVPAGIEGVVGTSHADQLTGDASNNEFNAGDGDDQILGGDGDDTGDGGAGDDLLNLGRGDDIAIGGPGTDTFSYAGRTADVTVIGDSNSPSGEYGENDHPTANGDVERIELGEGSGEYDGTMGNGGIVSVDGGAGYDTLRGSNAAEVLSGGAGDDTIYGYYGNDTLNGGDGEDRLVDTHGNDQLDGGAGTDTLDGGQGNDVVRGGAGNSDLVDYSAAPGAVKVSIDDVSNDGPPGQRDNVRTDVENVRGTTGIDVLVGDDSSNRLEGRGGNDKLYGDDGDDTLVGGTGTDQYTGGSGQDLVSYDDGRTSNVNVTMSNGANDGSAGENENVTSAGGIEGVVGSAKNDSLTGDGSGNQLYGMLGSDQLAGGSGPDVIYGEFDPASLGEALDNEDGGADTIAGGDGDDVVADAGGDDFVELGEGNDEWWPGHGSDTLDFHSRDLAVDFPEVGTGNVAALYENADYGGSLTGYVESDVIHNEVGDVERILLSDRSDRFRYQYFDSPDGPVYIDAGGGNDWVETWNSPENAEVRGGPGNDRIYSGATDDLLFGDAGDDIISNHSSVLLPGVDQVSGGDGDDQVTSAPDGTMSGGAGSDRLTIKSNVPGSGGTVTLDGIANDGSGSGGPGDVASDFESIDGSSGSDTIVALLTNQVSTVRGFAGDDVIDTRDDSGLGFPDWVHCGTGADQFGIDATDSALDCESTMP